MFLTETGSCRLTHTCLSDQSSPLSGLTAILLLLSFIYQLGWISNSFDRKIIVLISCRHARRNSNYTDDLLRSYSRYHKTVLFRTIENWMTLRKIIQIAKKFLFLFSMREFMRERVVLIKMENMEIWLANPAFVVNSNLFNFELPLTSPNTKDTFTERSVVVPHFLKRSFLHILIFLTIPLCSLIFFSSTLAMLVNEYLI